MNELQTHNMDKPPKHYAEPKNPVEDIMHESLCKKSLNRPVSTVVEIRTVLVSLGALRLVGENPARRDTFWG